MSEKPDQHTQKEDGAHKDAPEKKGRAGRVFATIGSATVGFVGAGALAAKDHFTRTQGAKQALDGILPNLSELSRAHGEEWQALKNTLMDSVGKSGKPVMEDIINASSIGDGRDIVRKGTELAKSLVADQQTWMSRVPGGPAALIGAATVGTAVAGYALARRHQNRKAQKEDVAEDKSGSHVERLQHEQANAKGNERDR